MSPNTLLNKIINIGSFSAHSPQNSAKEHSPSFKTGLAPEEGGLMTGSNLAFGSKLSNLVNKSLDNKNYASVTVTGVSAAGAKTTKDLKTG